MARRRIFRSTTAASLDAPVFCAAFDQIVDFVEARDRAQRGLFEKIASDIAIITERPSSCWPTRQRGCEMSY
jgi:hypothetical protein